MRQRPFRGGVDPFLVAVTTLLLLKVLAARALVFASASHVLRGLWLESAAALLFVGGLALLVGRRRWLLLLGYAAMCIVLVGNVMYAAYFQQIFDPAALSMLGDAVAVRDVAAPLMRPIYLLFFADIPLLAAWAFVLGRRGVRWSAKPVRAGVAVALAIFTVQVGFAVKAQPGVDASTISAARGLSVMQVASVAKGMLPGSESAFADAARPSQRLAVQLGQYADGVGGKRIAPFRVGAYADRPVIIVQFESLQSMLLEGRVNGSEVTPNLNQFARDSWYFPNSYSQTGAGNTSDAEFIVNTGLLGPMSRPASVSYVDRQLAGLPRMLAARGYVTYTMHGNTDRFWNRRELYPALGFTDYFDRDRLPERDKMGAGPSDEVVFGEALKVLGSREATRTLLEIVTLTSHPPFVAPKDAKRRPLKLPAKTAQTYAGAYVSSISYSDKAFGEFIQGLKKSGLYDKAIIVVVGDHTGYQESLPRPSDRPVLRQLLGRDYGQVDRQRVPIIVHVPGARGRRVESVRTQTDIMPTVADLLGVDLREVPHIGRSVFVEAPRMSPGRYYYPSGTLLVGDTLFVPKSVGGPVEAYNVLTGGKLASSEGYRVAAELARRANVFCDETALAMPSRDDAQPLGKDALIPGQSKWK